MSGRDDKVLLADVLDACAAAQRITAGKSRQDLDRDETLTLAVCHVIQIIGEAAGRMSEPFQSAHPELPWSQIVGMRNRLVHGYFSVDHDVLWKTVKDELPGLRAKIERI